MRVILFTCVALFAQRLLRKNPNYLKIITLPLVCFNRLGHNDWIANANGDWAKNIISDNTELQLMPWRLKDRGDYLYLLNETMVDRGTMQSQLTILTSLIYPSSNCSHGNSDCNDYTTYSLSISTACRLPKWQRCIIFNLSGSLIITEINVSIRLFETKKTYASHWYSKFLRSVFLLFISVLYEWFFRYPLYHHVLSRYGLLFDD